MIFKFSMAAFVLISGFSAFAAPARVIIIRHGEKPPQGNQVNQQGCERAFSLAQFFSNQSLVNEFGKPVAIYAFHPKGTTGSVRAIQTMAPTAQALGLKVDANFYRDDYGKLAQEVLNSPEDEGKTVLISWEHSVITDMAQSFGLPAGDSPQNWNADVFDQAWVLDFSQNGSNKVSLSIIPEFVLPTDNSLGGLDHWNDGPQTPTAASPTLSSQIKAECVNNDALNAIVTSVTAPALSSEKLAN